MNKWFTTSTTTTSFTKGVSSFVTIRRQRLRLPVSRSACCVGAGVMVFNLLSLYLLHTSPSPWMHAHGGVLPRGVGSRSRLGHGAGGGLEWVVMGGESELLPCRRLSFVKDADSHVKPVALASVPGSGNTWLRYLLQQATGVLTGSMYNDAFLSAAGFPGEGISNGSVLVVKTHEAQREVRRHFRSAVLLIRHPLDAILAEFNRQHGGHLGHASARDFQEYWSSYAIEAVKQWSAFNTEWLRFSGPLHITHYEDLLHDLNATLSSLLRFLNASVTQQDVRCAVTYSGHAYRRRKKKKVDEEKVDEFLDSDLFGEELLAVLEESEEQFNNALKKYYHYRNNYGKNVTMSL